tara:strand:- start:140 stop:1372 length:1233 start_codon:yes stop_codon:yes gene_type:complete
MASTNKFDKQVLDSALGTSRAKFAKQESIAAPKTDDETQEFEVTSTEYTIHMNGKNFQLIEENGSLHFVDKNHGTGITIDKNGDTYIISGPGGNGNACAGRLLINSRGGQLVKSGNFTAEYTANSNNSVNGEGSSSSTTKRGNKDATSTAAQSGSADAKSETCYGDNTCEVFGDFNVNATNIHLQATDTLYINADSKIVITAGKDGGGSMEIHAGELLHKVQTLRDEISSAHIRDGVPETTNIHYDPRSNTSSVGFHNRIEKISGDYKLEVGGSMNFSVLGLPNPNPVAFATDAATGDLTTKMQLSVLGGDFAVETTVGSVLVKAGPDLSFPGVLLPGSLSVAAAGGAQISAGPDLSLPELVAGNISMQSGTSTTIDATTSVDITGTTGVNIESPGDISILSTAGKIYLN